MTAMDVRQKGRSEEEEKGESLVGKPVLTNGFRMKSILTLSVLCLMLSIFWVWRCSSNVKSASLQATIRTAFSEYIGIRYKTLRLTTGEFEIPMGSRDWKYHKLGEFFAGNVNELPSGRYRYRVVKLNSGITKFHVVNSSGRIVSEGIVPNDLITLSGDEN